MAVYTDVTEEDLQSFAAEYELGEIVSFKGIAEGVENSNYLLQTASAGYILTLYEKRVRAEDLPFFLGLMEHLSRKGISCPTPIHGRDGSTLRTLCGRPAAIVTFLQGLSPRRVSNRHCAELGRALAAMHLAAGDFELTRKNDLSVEGWHRLCEQCAERAHEVRPGLAAELGAEVEAMEKRWPADLPRGVIHADLFPDNVFFLGEKLSGMIDFYFACNDFLAYDLAVCLNAWCFEADGGFNITKARHLLSAYRQVRPFTGPELAALPVLARGSALRFLLTRLHDWLYQPEGALVRPKDPLEYLRKLRFHQEVHSPAAYGLE